MYYQKLKHPKLCTSSPPPVDVLPEGDTSEVAVSSSPPPVDVLPEAETSEVDVSSSTTVDVLPEAETSEVMYHHPELMYYQKLKHPKLIHHRKNHKSFRLYLLRYQSTWWELICHSHQKPS